MSALGDFLEAIFAASSRFGSVRATIRRWQDLDLAGRADGGSRTPIGRPKASAGPDVVETDLTVWFSPPGRLRVDEVQWRGYQAQRRVAVLDGERWWERDGSGGVETNAPGRTAPDPSDTRMHFDNRRLREILEALALEELGPMTFCGHDGVRIRATVRPGESLWPHWFPKGADEYDLLALPHRGVLLAVTARYQGVAFETAEVTDLAFDEPLGDALFHYEPAPGEVVTPAIPVVVRLTFAEAAAAVPFALFVPARLPPGAFLGEVMLHPASRRGPVSVTLSYERGEPDSRLWLTESAAAAADGAGGQEWEAVSRAGRAMRISDPGEGLRIVGLDLAGTHISICSNLSREPLLDLAASLAPATT